MESTGKYKNLAGANHPATCIYLVDISGSMKATMPDGRSRIDAVKSAIQNAYATMIHRSLRQGVIHPRYRVGMIAYTSDLYDVYGDMGSIISVEKLKDMGIPLIRPQSATDMAKAFRYANKLIQEDIRVWPQKWLNECPAPIVVNITDCEFGEETQDPVDFALKLQEISVSDGNVLVENIYITDQIILPSADIKDWRGYRFNESTGDPYGDKLLTMSSPIPASYARIMSEQTGLKVQEGTAMMFPCNSQEFINTGIKAGIVMSIVTAAQVSSPPRLQNYIHENTITPHTLRVFLCHSSADKPKVRELFKRLNAEKWVDPWLDEKKLKGGQDWNFEIQNAVATSDIIIVCLSKSSITKEGFIQKEIKMALDKADEKPEGEVFIIPLKLEECDAPVRLQQWQWLNAYGNGWYKKLIDSLSVRANKLGVRRG